MSLLREDLYVVFGGTVDGTEQAVFRFTINPLVWWVWYGGMIVALGGLIVMWPGGGSPAVKRSQAGDAGRVVEDVKAGHDGTTARCQWVGGALFGAPTRFSFPPPPPPPPPPPAPP